MAEEGWIKLYRQIQYNVFWPHNRPYTKLEAWLYLLLRANHADNRDFFDIGPVEIKRGQFITSEVKLAEKWKWDRGTVRRFLKILQNDEQMIIKTATSKYTVITIVNYEKYQSDTTGNTTGNATAETTAETTVETTQTRIKELKNVRSVSNSVGNIFTPPTLEEVKDYCKERNRGVDPEKWINFYQAKGWMVGKNKMKDWKAAVRTWEKDRKPQTKPSGMADLEAIIRGDDIDF